MRICTCCFKNATCQTTICTSHGRIHHGCAGYPACQLENSRSALIREARNLSVVGIAVLEGVEAFAVDQVRPERPHVPASYEVMRQQVMR